MRLEVVNVRELARATSGLMDEVEAGRACFLVTRRGRPVAAITPIDHEAFEDFVLAHAPAFVRQRPEADRDLVEGRTMSLTRFMEQLKAEEMQAESG
jgi:prevent-host-death family protein